jgi:L-malate glycosyltransferase
MTTRRAPYRTCFLIDQLSRAGTESQLLLLLRQLDRTQVTPYLALLDGTDKTSQLLQPDNCPVLKLGVRSFARPSLITALLRFTRFLRQEKIEFLHLLFRDSTYFGLLAGRLARVKRIVLSRRNIGHWMTFRDRCLMRLCQRLAHATIANSEASRRAVIAQERARPERVFILPNGIDLGRFADMPPYSPKLNGEPRRVGVVSNLRSVKGIEVFIRAAARVAGEFPNVEFPVAGDGDAAAYREVARECGIADKVRFLGPVVDVPAFLARLDVAVLPSHAEGFSNSLLEYMAAGRPIVATAVGGNLEIIEHEGNGLLVPKGDVDAMGRAILALLSDTELIAKIVAACRRKVAASYSREAVGRGYVELLRIIGNSDQRT